MEFYNHDRMHVLFLTRGKSASKTFEKKRFHRSPYVENIKYAVGFWAYISISMPYSYQYSISRLRGNTFIKMKNIIVITIIVEQPVLIFLTHKHKF